MLTAWSTDCSASKVINPKPSQRPKVNQGSRVLGQNKVKNRGRGVDQGDTSGFGLCCSLRYTQKFKILPCKRIAQKEFLSLWALNVQTSQLNYYPQKDYCYLIMYF